MDKQCALQFDLCLQLKDRLITQKFWQCFQTNLALRLLVRNFYFDEKLKFIVLSSRKIFFRAGSKKITLNAMTNFDVFPAFH